MASPWGPRFFWVLFPGMPTEIWHLKKNMCAHVHKKTRMYTHNYTQIDYIYIYIYMLYVCEFSAHVYVYIYIFLWGTCKCKQKCINMQTRYWSFIFWDKLDQLTDKDIHSPFWLQRGGATWAFRAQAGFGGDASQFFRIFTDLFPNVLP